MSEYVKRFKSGRISHYLRTSQLVTGKWGIDTKPFNRDSYILNINYPLFSRKEEAEKFLIENFECLK